MAVSDYSTTAADNTSISGLTVSDSTVADTLDNIIRQLMADIKAADDANAKFGSTETITGSWTFNTIDVNGGTLDGVTIGGSSAGAGTFTGLTVNNAAVAILDLKDTGGTSTHQLVRVQNGDGSFIIQTRDSSGTLVSNDYLMTLGASGVTEHSIRVENTEVLEVTSSGVDVIGLCTSDGFQTSSPSTMGTTVPAAPGTYNLGSVAARWANIYLTNTPNVSSDARLKKDIAQLADAEVRVGQILKGLIRTYRLKEGDDRKRVGVIAQEVIEAFEAEGLDWRDYNILTGSAEEGYGVSYDELLALVIGAL